MRYSQRGAERARRIVLPAVVKVPVPPGATEHQHSEAADHHHGQSPTRRDAAAAASRRGPAAPSVVVSPKDGCPAILRNTMTTAAEPAGAGNTAPPLTPLTDRHPSDDA